MYNVTRRRVRVIIVAVETLTYSECVSVALVIKHAMRMRRIIFSSVTCLTNTFFTHHLLHDTIFRTKVLCVWLPLEILSETFVL
jgi:hypothetical protein